MAGAYLHGAHAHGLSVHHLSCYAWLQGSPTFYVLEKSTKWPNSWQVNHEKKKILSQPQYSLSYRFLISSLSSIVCKNQYWPSIITLCYIILFFYLACNFFYKNGVIKNHFTMVLKTFAVGGS